MTAFNKIVVQGCPPSREAKVASDGTITPGDLIERKSTDEMKVHATAGGTVGCKYFAVENLPVGGEISDAYAVGSIVQFVHAQAGDLINARILDGDNIVIGDKLESGGNGRLRKLVADTSAGTIKPGAIIAEAREAKDMSSSALIDGTGRCLVEII